MIFGTAGITAVFALQALECHGLSPEKGEVLVTGAAGGVGSFSIALLAALGYDVAAVTGRIDESGGYLRELGAKTLVPAATLPKQLHGLWNQNAGLAVLIMSGARCWRGSSVS